MRWLRFLRRAEWDQERLDELESYLQIATDDYIAQGMTPVAARHVARRSSVAARGFKRRFIA